MKYAFIQRHKRVWPIRVQCRVLRVSVSGYHQHLVRRREIAQRRHLSDEALLVHISAAYAENRGAYGWPRIWRQLRAQGIRVGKQRVQRLMQQHGIRARGKRRFRVTTTDSKPITTSSALSATARSKFSSPTPKKAKVGIIPPSLQKRWVLQCSQRRNALFMEEPKCEELDTAQNLRTANGHESHLRKEHPAVELLLVG
jgi:putative transposase